MGLDINKDEDLEKNEVKRFLKGKEKLYREIESKFNPKEVWLIIKEQNENS